MKIYLDCYPCLVGQAIRAARLTGADENQQLNTVQQTLALLQNMPPGATPPQIGYHVYQIVREQVGSQDPYREIKHASTQQALALYPKLKTLVEQSNDLFDMAIRLSIAGNIIDFALSDQIADLWETVERVTRQPFAFNDIPALKARLAAADHLLYLADNAGETVFDRVLIEALPVPVIYAVKGDPILNDAILEDAQAAGLDTCATLISNGAQASGTILSLCSAEFRQYFDRAPIVIAKGQANYETLSEGDEKIFFLLQVKCPIIGRDLSAPVGSIVARQNRSRS